ncbi:MAG: hypothetical protein GY953_49900, partial [bacterium]|nr:hypothetical protein [bacterium]
LSVVLAARLCAEREAFAKAEQPILFTHDYQTNSTDGDLKAVDYDFRPKGFIDGIRIFRQS